MKKPIRQILKPIPQLFLASLVLLLGLNSCRKDDLIAFDSGNLAESPLLHESRILFNQQLAAHPATANDGVLRHQAHKIPLWDQAVQVELSVGPALKVPLVYEPQIFIQVGPNKESVPLSELGYLLLYNDSHGQQHAEVVIRIPDAEYWAHRNEEAREFSGITIVEDWWGRPIKTFKKTPGQEIIMLGSPVRGELPGRTKAKEEIENMVSDDRPHPPCEVITSRNSEGMYEVEFICPAGASDNGPNDGGHRQGEGEGTTSGGHPDSGGGGGGSGIGSGSEDSGNGDSNVKDPLRPGEYEDPLHGRRHRCRNPNILQTWCTDEDEYEQDLADRREQFLEKIDDSMLKPCIKNVLADIKKLSNGSVASIIQKFAGDIPGYNWKIVDGSLPQYWNAGTESNYDKIEKSVTTIFDSRKFNNSSDLMIAQNILHESIHAYLTTYFALNRPGFIADYPTMVKEWGIYNNWSSVHHEEFARSLVNNVASALKEYSILKGYVINDPNYFNDMAWAGLIETATFQNLSESDKNRMKNLFSSEQTGYNLSEEYIGIKGILVNCNQL